MILIPTNSTYLQDPRPHASLLWTLGNISPSLIEIREKLNKLNSSSKAKPIWSHFVNKIVHELDEGSEESQVKRIYHDFKFSSEVNQFGGKDEDLEGVTLAEEELSLKQLHR